MSTKKTHTIWSNTSEHINSIVNALKESEEFCKCSDDELWERASDLNTDYLDDERINLNIQLSSPIICIGNIGRWNGRVFGYRKIESGNISDCFYSECDLCTWFVDEDNDLRCDAIHHDGTNHYLYRELKADIDPDDWEYFQDALLTNNFTDEDLDKFTLPVGTHISKIYGWE